jgi:hypothetical protein
MNEVMVNAVVKARVAKLPKDLVIYRNGCAETRGMLSEG